MKNIMSFETFEGSNYNPLLVRQIEDKLKARDKKFKKKRIVLSMPDFAMKDKEEKNNK